jgi:hypothetical protein
MEMLDNYLKSVRSCLPEAQRDDIINELSENLRSQIEDQETGLGRRLTDAEVEAILKQHGHPLVVAGRYRQDHRSVAFGRQWIGPTLFPFYVRVLKFNLGLTSLILIGVFVALLASGQSITLLNTLPEFLYSFLIQFTIITVIFAAADQHWTLHPDSWDPRNLKHPWHPAFAIQAELKRGSDAKKDERRVSRFDSVCQFVSMGVGLAWLRVAQGAPFMIFGPAAAIVKPAPVWHQFYTPVVFLFVAGMLQAVINLFRPDWFRFRLVYRLLNDAAWLVIVVLLLKAGRWVVMADVAGASEGYRRTAEILNQLVPYGLAGLAVFIVVSVVRNLSRIVRPAQPPVPSRGA